MPDAEEADVEPPPRLVIERVHAEADWSELEPLAPLLDRLAAEIVRYVKLPAASQAVLALSSDPHVRILNRKYSGKDRATNVLSFPARSGSDAASHEAAFLGDIVLAKETVLREARESGLPPRHHVAHLVVHGLLHLLGYDHDTDAQADEMEALEARILAPLGIADPRERSAPTTAA